MADFLDDQEFYELMQTYRHTPRDRQEDVVEAYKAVKQYVRDKIEWLTEKAYSVEE